MNIDDIDIRVFIAGICGVGAVLLILYYFLSMIRNLLRSYSFSDLGSKFNKSFYSLSDFGLEGSDHFDFKIKLRTDDALNDCDILGRYQGGKMKEIRIDGEGEKCKKLRSNNKL